MCMYLYMYLKFSTEPVLVLTLKGAGYLSTVTRSGGQSLI